MQLSQGPHLEPVERSYSVLLPPLPPPPADGGTSRVPGQLVRLLQRQRGAWRDAAGVPPCHGTPPFQSTGIPGWARIHQGKTAFATPHPSPLVSRQTRTLTGSTQRRLAAEASTQSGPTTQLPAARPASTLGVRSREGATTCVTLGFQQCVAFPGKHGTWRGLHGDRGWNEGHGGGVLGMLHHRPLRLVTLAALACMLPALDRLQPIPLQSARRPRVQSVTCWLSRSASRQNPTPSPPPSQGTAAGSNHRNLSHTLMEPRSAVSRRCSAE